MTTEGELKVSLWKLRAVGWVGVLFFSFGCLGATWSGEWKATPIFIGFVVLSSVVLLCAGRFVADAEGLTLTLPLGVYTIRWDEIRHVEKGQSSLVLVGDNKHLSIPTAEWWGGRDREAFREVFERFVQEREIEVIPKWTADYRFQKNTRKRA